jgi:hypothetical protein
MTERREGELSLSEHCGFQTNELVRALSEDYAAIWDLLINVADQNKMLGKFQEASVFYQAGLLGLEKSKGGSFFIWLR